MFPRLRHSTRLAGALLTWAACPTAGAVLISPYLTFTHAMLAARFHLISLRPDGAAAAIFPAPPKLLTRLHVTRAYQTTKDRPNIALPLKLWGKGWM
jgi:hypothetical protein